MLNKTIDRKWYNTSKTLIFFQKIRFSRTGKYRTIEIIVVCTEPTQNAHSCKQQALSDWLIEGCCLFAHGSALTQGHSTCLCVNKNRFLTKVFLYRPSI